MVKHRFSSAVYVPPKNPQFLHQNLTASTVFFKNRSLEYVPFMEY